jgi:prepilin-type N-terminal cleavage/methylation domain-containing protein
MIKSQIAKARQDESGFTLIELLIVIVVLGILAGVVVFGVGTFREDSSLAACKANLKTVSVASDAFIAKTGAPAASVAALVTAKYLKTAPPSGDAITLNASGDAVSAYPGGLCVL